MGLSSACLRSLSEAAQGSAYLLTHRSWISRIGTGFRKWSFSRPRRLVTTRPASSSCLRCFITPKRVIGKRSSSALSVCPSATNSSSSRLRRVGSARALNTSSTLPNIRDQLVTCQSGRLGGAPPVGYRVGNDRLAPWRGRLVRYGGIEAGGTKWVCAVADRPAELLKTETFPTTSPGATVARAVRFFTGNGPVAALGVGAFGPVDIRPASPTWGTITTTPKPGWADTDLVAALRSGLGVPIALDTDVNAAALGEWRHGAATG